MESIPCLLLGKWPRKWPDLESKLTNRNPQEKLLICGVGLAKCAVGVLALLWAWLKISKGQLGLNSQEMTTPSSKWDIKK